ncbi:MAG TPA: hypothetical protein VMV79_08815, partial [Alphaproteobacteria bacterium]|nr:hypothetical protein [Alphaproteobacteria bacterium]
MADGSTQNPNAPNAARMQTLLTAFRQVGMPLLQALAESAPWQETPPLETRVEKFGPLVDSTVTLSREIAAQVGADEDKVDAWVRWALAGGASQIVASNFRATGNPLPDEEAKRLAGLVGALQDKFKPMLPAGSESLPNTVATFRAKMLETLVPVVGAVAQYSFGRAEHALLAEVAERLVRTADQVTRALAPAGSTAEEWRLLCWNVLKAAGQIYTESHYAEADRLLYMNPDERAAYFAKHGNIVPMAQVWQAFNQR